MLNRLRLSVIVTISLFLLIYLAGPCWPETRRKVVVNVGIDTSDLREIIREILKVMDVVVPVYSEDVVELLILTAAQESKCGKYLRQIGGGPARGIFGIEPATEKFVLRKVEKVPSLALIGRMLKGNLYFYNKDLDRLALWGNIPYQVFIARLVYYFKTRDGIPTTLRGLAEYYKEHFNTVRGKATVAEAIVAYRALGL